MIAILVCLFWAWSFGTAGAQEPQWHKIPPVRQYANPRLGKLLPDIESHMPPGHIYASNDLVNWAHETTHGLNSRIRNGVRGGGTGAVNAFYVGGDRAAVMREPRLRKSAVAGLVPTLFREAGQQNSTFGLYVVGQGSWDGEPLYLLDEWTAYQNGTETAIELSKIGHRMGERESVENMLEFAAFATCLLRLVEARDPYYPDKPQLTAYVGYGLVRSIELGQAAQSIPGLASPRGQQLIAALKAEFTE